MLAYFLNGNTVCFFFSLFVSWHVKCCRISTYTSSLPPQLILTWGFVQKVGHWAALYDRAGQYGWWKCVRIIYDLSVTYWITVKTLFVKSWQLLTENQNCQRGFSRSYLVFKANKTCVFWFFFCVFSAFKVLCRISLALLSCCYNGPIVGLCFIN